MRIWIKWHKIIVGAEYFPENAAECGRQCSRCSCRHSSLLWMFCVLGLRKYNSWSECERFFLLYFAILEYEQKKKTTTNVGIAFYGQFTQFLATAPLFAHSQYEAMMRLRSDDTRQQSTICAVSNTILQCRTTTTVEPKIHFALTSNAV